MAHIEQQPNGDLGSRPIGLAAGPRMVLVARGRASVNAAEFSSELRIPLSGRPGDLVLGPESRVSGGGSTALTIVPTDSTGMALARTPRQAADIVLGAQWAPSGRFHPAGQSGDLAQRLGL